MKRYNLLKEDDLIKGRHYEVVSTIGQNPNPMSETAYYDKYGNWCGIPDNHTILEIIDNSVMLVLAKENPERYIEIVLGGSYDDGKFNNERCRTSYVDYEEKYPVISCNFKQRDASEMEL
jgi:hypothetical protein